MFSHGKNNREILEQFIKTYREQDCLWNLMSADYYNKHKKDEAYNVLLDIYRLIDPDADKGAVIRKINSLRTNYRREKHKVDKRRRINQFYEPTLWYYYEFNFLEDQEKTILTNNSQRVETEEELNIHDYVIRDDQESYEQEDENDEFISIEEFSSNHNQSISTSPSENIKSNKRACNKSGKENDYIEYGKRLKHERYDIFGKNVAIKMKDICDNTQRLLAEKLINDVMFLAEMGLLTTTHSIANNGLSMMELPVHSSYTNSNFHNSSFSPGHTVNNLAAIVKSENST